MQSIKLLLSAGGLALSVLAAPVFAASTARDHKVEEANRKLVIEFYHKFFNGHELVKSTSVISNDYKQHNPNVADGKDAFVSFFVTYFKDHPNYRTKVVQTAADGDLVWLHSHFTDGPDDRGQAVVDIYRVKAGKIVEHWDVIQNVPEKSANPHTMF